jgi:uncharacterized protein YdaU (DUF1376 family)
MQIYVGDELAETSHLSAEEYGSHMRLRLHQWLHGELPQDDERLRRICLVDREHWPNIRDALAPLFDLQWHHARTAELRRKSEEKREKMAENGRKGGRPAKPEAKPIESKSKANGEAKGKADRKPNETPSPSPSPSESPSSSRSSSSSSPESSALDGRGEEDRRNMFKAFPAPASASEGKAFLLSKGVPHDQIDACLRLLMGENFSPFDLEGILSDARSAA